MYSASSPTCVIRSRMKPRPSNAEVNKEYSPKSEFTFINLSDPNQSKDKDLRKTVRSQAMRAYSQMVKQKAPAKRRQTTESDTTETRGRESLVDAQTDNNWSEKAASALVEAEDLLQPRGRTLGLGGSKMTKHSPRFSCGHADCNESGYLLQVSRPRQKPQTVIGNGMTDPFDTFPVRGSGRYNAYVLNHCTSLLLLLDLITPPTASRAPVDKSMSSRFRYCPQISSNRPRSWQ